MKLERKHALVLLGIASGTSSPTCASSRPGRHRGRPTGYYVAHTILIVVNLFIAGLLGTWGVRAYKAAKVT